LGECDEPKVKEVSLDALRSLRVVAHRAKDPEVFSRGQVPPWVLFLTAGQDSRDSQLHHCIWGWGVRQTTAGARLLCGALIEWAEILRPVKSNVFNEADYYIFDDLIYGRHFRCTDGEKVFRVIGCAHDIGYEPTMVPLIRYCRRFPGRAIPAKGASLEASSACRADYIRMGQAKRHKIGDEEVFDDPSLVINTFILKNNWYAWVEQRIEVEDRIDGTVVGVRKVSRLALPEDVNDLWLTQSRNEKLSKNEKDELVWKKTGPNHIADCNTYAYAVALHYDPHTKNRTAEEYGQMRAARRAQTRDTRHETRERHDPSMG
jgi:phage terminase large subunit GpA-like protein